MNGRWYARNARPSAVRDLARDDGQVDEGLEEQRRRFDHEGAVSYSSIRDLLGEAMRKGVFWRLKDTAHHLFRQQPVPDPGQGRHPALAVLPAAVIPTAWSASSRWRRSSTGALGYAFHECAKLREERLPAPALRQPSGPAGTPSGRDGRALRSFAPAGRAADRREAPRASCSASCMCRGMVSFLLLRYLEGQEDNTHPALAGWSWKRPVPGRSSPTCTDDLLSALQREPAPAPVHAGGLGPAGGAVAARRPAACWNAPPEWVACTPRA